MLYYYYYSTMIYGTRDFWYETANLLCIRTQADVTKKLGERIHDINFWKFELQREIDDLIAETELLFLQKVT